MSKELNIKLKDTVSNYQDKDLSLKVFMRGSLVLDIKIGAGWEYPENYGVPYTDGECKVLIEKEGRNGEVEAVLANEFPTWNGKFMSASIVDSDEEAKEIPTDVEQISIPSAKTSFSFDGVVHDPFPLRADEFSDAVLGDDCCGDTNDCCKETPNEEE